MRFINFTLFLLGLGLICQAIYMDTKAFVAQALISNSWSNKVDAGDSEQASKPWPWADTRPVAKLSITRLDKSLFVMQDSSGESLAFGPGHVPSSALPGEGGHVAIAGHRDTHFSFLEDIQQGDIITTENFRSDKTRYRVVGLDVINTEVEGLRSSNRDLLSLITCYPFDDWVPGGPLRYIVTAEAIESPERDHEPILNSQNQTKPNYSTKPAIIDKS